MAHHERTQRSLRLIADRIEKDYPNFAQGLRQIAEALAAGLDDTPTPRKRGRPPIITAYKAGYDAGTKEQSNEWSRGNAAGLAKKEAKQ